MGRVFERVQPIRLAVDGVLSLKIVRSRFCPISKCVIDFIRDFLVWLDVEFAFHVDYCKRQMFHIFLYNLPSEVGVCVLTDVKKMHPLFMT